jgi:hypothetical protein
MLENLKLPEYKGISYSINKNLERFEIRQKNPLPETIPGNIDFSFHEKTETDFDLIISGEIPDKETVFLIGLNFASFVSEFSDLYFGEYTHLKTKKKSYILIYFHLFMKGVTLYYFDNYNPSKRERNQFVRTFYQLVISQE